MKKIEKRAAFCLLLALLLVAGLGLFTFRFLAEGSGWVSQAFNRHLYNTSGELAVGTVLDRDGDVLSSVDENGNRTYNDSEDVRKATLHVVGDAQGNIGTGALSAFADKLSGYNFLTGAGSAGTGTNLYLTIDARYNYTAYKALDGNNGVVAVYNYKTGEILCLVSAPTYDPLNVPDDLLTNDKYSGAFLNRFYSSTFVPGSIFKTVTLAAALDTLSDLTSRTWTCTGSLAIGDGIVTCPKVHGDLDIQSALANSCNVVFGQLAVEMGAQTMQTYTEKAGLTSSYSINGISTAAGTFSFTGDTENELAWAGVGQYNDLVNPCSMLVYMGAIANGGQAAIPQIILQTKSAYGFPLSYYFTRKTGTLISASAAQALQTYMANDVEETYGSDRFPNMQICAKSGTAEVGGGKDPNAWFVGYLENTDEPLAFVVLVENGGGGSSVAGSVASQVLDVIVNGYSK